MAATDYHAACVTAVRAAVEALALGPPVVAVDDLDALSKAVSAPAIVVCPVGPWQTRPEMSTNGRNGRGYPVSVMLYATGTVNGAKGGPLTPTQFLSEIADAFDLRRLAAVPLVAWCEVDTAPVLFDKDSPAFQRIQTVATVVCVGRFPRGS